MAPHLSFQRDGAAIRPVPLSDGAWPLPPLETGTRSTGVMQKPAASASTWLWGAHCPGGAGSTGHQFAAQPAYSFPAYNDRLILTPDVALAFPGIAGSTACDGRWRLTPSRTGRNLGKPPWRVSGRSIPSSCASPCCSEAKGAGGNPPGAINSISSQPDSRLQLHGLWDHLCCCEPAVLHLQQAVRHVQDTRVMGHHQHGTAVLGRRPLQ